MKTAFHILVSLISMILLFSSGANAYKGQTHRDITNQAIQYLGEEDEYSLVCTNIATLIADGSVEEDNPLLTLRSWFHYSPTLYSLYALATWAEPGSGLDMGHPIFKFFYHFHQ